MKQPLPVTRYPLPAKKGFTLIELITVIIIISIMVGVALPKYMQMAEKTKASNARQVLDILRKAEEANYAEVSVYTTYKKGDTGDITVNLPLTKIESDTEWVYGVLTSDPSNKFTATANRQKGPSAVNGKTIELNQDGEFHYCATVGCVTDNTTTKGFWY